MVDKVMSPQKAHRYDHPKQINSGYINLKNGGYNLHKSAQKAAANSLSLNVIKTTNPKTERNKQQRKQENANTQHDPVLPPVERSANASPRDLSTPQLLPSDSKQTSGRNSLKNTAQFGNGVNIELANIPVVDMDKTTGDGDQVASPNKRRMSRKSPTMPMKQPQDYSNPAESPTNKPSTNKRVRIDPQEKQFVDKVQSATIKKNLKAQTMHANKTCDDPTYQSEGNAPPHKRFQEKPVPSKNRTLDHRRPPKVKIYKESDE